MRYIPYDELGEMTSIIVDGAGTTNTLLTLSHWPNSGTPRELKDDLSTQIVFRYLDRPEFQVNAEAVSNNHFDEDGLVSIFALLHPTEAQMQRNFLIDVAAAGDFGTYRIRDAARTAFVLSAFADPSLSPLDAAIFQQPYPKLAASLYIELLPRLADLTRHLEKFCACWEAEDAMLTESEAMIRAGQIQIEEFPSLDLAVVKLPETLPGQTVHRFTQQRRAACHPMALNNAVHSFRVLLMQGQTYELHYRYESYVQYISRRPLPRIDLAPLATQLSQEEHNEWTFDGVDELIPTLRLNGTEESRLSPERFVTLIQEYLSTATARRNPYDQEG